MTTASRAGRKPVRPGSHVPLNDTLSSPDPRLGLRFAAEGDAALLLDFIRQLAEYEKLAHEVVADEAALRETLFSGRRAAEVVLAFWENEPAGFALFFHNYSTFLARPGRYLEDLFVVPRLRGKGIGQILLRTLARIAVERGCGRFEWSVLDWNVDAIRFYERLGAKPMDGWTTFRVTGDALAELAGPMDAGERENDRTFDRLNVATLARWDVYACPGRSCVLSFEL